MNRKHRGAYAELVAITHLLGEGYEVFRNVSPHGLIDLVGIRDGVSVHFDVKTAQVGAAGRLRARLSDEQVKAGIKCINVYDDDVVEIDWNPEAKFVGRLRLCAQCGGQFKPTNRQHVFCLPKCRQTNFQAKMGEIIDVRSN